MIDRRDILALGVLGGAALLSPVRAALAAEECSAATRAEAIGSALLDRYVAAVNAHHTSSFPEIHTESYIQHSGRTANGLAAQIENFRAIFGRMPDVQRGSRIESSPATRSSRAWPSPQRTPDPCKASPRPAGASR
jgi:hypothetical protein